MKDIFYFTITILLVSLLTYMSSKKNLFPLFMRIAFICFIGLIIFITTLGLLLK